MNFTRFTWFSVGLLVLVCTVIATGLFLQVGKTQASAEALTNCSQAAIVDIEHKDPFLKLKGANVAIPKEEPQIVATVDGHPITATQLEVMVSSAVYNNQTILASLGANVSPNLKAQLTRSPATLRQMSLTQLIDDNLWLSAGKQSGKYTSVADAKKFLAQSVALSRQVPVNNRAHLQFTAFLCANNLTEASYQTDPSVVQMVQDRLTVAAAKAHTHSALSTTQQQDAKAISAVEGTTVQSLWIKNKVKVFLPGFVPLRG